MDISKNLLFLLLLNIGCVSSPEPLELPPVTDYVSSRKLPPRLRREQPQFEKAREWMDRHTQILEDPPNSNRSEIIDKWNKMAGVPVGSFWCGSAAGAFIKYMGHEPPKGYAWTPNWAVPSRKVTNTQVGDIATFYFPRKKRIAHVGVKYETRGLSYIIWEGNSNDNGSRNGDRTVKKLRPKNTIHGFYRWLPDER